MLLISPLGVCQIYDDAGDVTLSPPFVGDNPVFGGRAGGDILNTITAPLSRPAGIAHDGVNLLVIFSIDDPANIYRLNESTGAIVGTVPIDGSGEYGLGYDHVRKLYVTADPGTDTINIYDGISSTPIMSHPAPGTGPTGVAYDINRDVYWVCDWMADSVSAINPTTGAVLITYSTAPTCTRNIGVGYDWINDELVLGGRDQKINIIMDAATGLIKSSFSANGSGGSIPRGTTVTPRQTIWEGDYVSTVYDMWEVDAGHGSVPHTLIQYGAAISEASGGIVDFKLEAGNVNGDRNYMIFGTVTGIFPGIKLKKPTILPINWDIFTTYVVLYANTGPFVNFFGKLIKSGEGKAQLSMKGPLPKGAAGLLMNFAYALNKPLNFASNPVVVRITN